jgi:hypothetical protein
MERKKETFDADREDNKLRGEMPKIREFKSTIEDLTEEEKEAVEREMERLINLMQEDREVAEEELRRLLTVDRQIKKNIKPLAD